MAEHALSPSSGVTLSDHRPSRSVAVAAGVMAKASTPASRPKRPRRNPCKLSKFALCSINAFLHHDSAQSPPAAQPRRAARRGAGGASRAKDGGGEGEGGSEISHQPHAPYSVAGAPHQPRRSALGVALPGSVQARSSAVTAAGDARQAGLPHARRQGRRAIRRTQRRFPAWLPHAAGRGDDRANPRDGAASPYTGAQHGGVRPRVAAAVHADPVRGGAGARSLPPCGGGTGWGVVRNQPHARGIRASRRSPRDPPP
jgi:hypothetical protein